MADDLDGPKTVSSIQTPGSKLIGKPGQAFPVFGSPAVMAARKRNRANLGLPAEDEVPIAKPATATRSISKR
jgi:hypothetical protein